MTGKTSHGALLVMYPVKSLFVRNVISRHARRVGVSPCLSLRAKAARELVSEAPTIRDWRLFLEGMWKPDTTSPYQKVVSIRVSNCLSLMVASEGTSLLLGVFLISVTTRAH
jgi:hypothetical protein